ncbi:MAG: DUF4062 domain-containing protein [Gammaproteobacteria bacterium]
MARVYVSSTLKDLEDERKAVFDWLVAANHQPVHSYRPDSETVRDSCLADIDGCDLYVLILGHRYGFQPGDGNPDNLSITHLEYRRGKGKPHIALLRTSIPDVALSDIGHSHLFNCVQAFREEVQRDARPAEFSDIKDLIQALSTGVQNEIQKLQGVTSQVSPNSPEVMQIIATLTRQLDSKDTENTTLRNSVIEMSNRVTELETQLQMAVARTLTAAAQPDASTAQIAAAVALQEGDTQPAEALMRAEERAADEEAQSPQVTGEDEIAARRRAAALAREQGALAFSHDVRAALAAYQRAAEHDPEDIETHFYVGDLHVALGDLAAARRSYDIAQSVAEQRVASDADNDEAQRDLSVSHNRIGDVLVAQGDLAAALAAYRNSLAIAEALAARDAANTQWQRDLAVGHDGIGDVLVAQGGLAGALAAYRNSLDIHETLAARDPANTEWQRDLSVSHNRIGDVRVAQGDLAGALAAYCKNHEICETLVARDAANTGWQRDLAVGHDGIGDVLVAQGDLAGALAAYRKSHEICETLAALDAANTEWQRNLSISHNKIGDVRVAQGDLAGALAAYRNSLDIRETLAARDAANVQWQIDIVMSCGKLGMHAGLSADERRGYLRRGLDIQQGLKTRGQLPPNQDWIGWFEAQLHKLDGD